MGKYPKVIHITVKPRKQRSPFANIRFSGNGPHKSVKDYNRQRCKLETKKSFMEEN